MVIHKECSCVLIRQTSFIHFNVRMRECCLLVYEVCGSFVNTIPTCESDLEYEYDDVVIWNDSCVWLVSSYYARDTGYMHARAHTHTLDIVHIYIYIYIYTDPRVSHAHYAYLHTYTHTYCYHEAIKSPYHTTLLIHTYIHTYMHTSTYWNCRIQHYPYIHTYKYLLGL